MTESQQLLADYARNGSEDAFRGLVTRYLALVYSTAIRLVGGDVHRARDVAQIVFSNLARKARALPSDVMLGGWLHRDTCFIAAKIIRTERRRLARERQFAEMNSFQDHSRSDLMRVAPILDEAINQLGREDRTAIVLRFFEQRDFRTVGEALGGTEDAARMRVKRALDKLHSLLKRRGVTMSVAALGAVLAAGAVTAAPAGMAGSVSGAALAAAAAGSGTTTVAFLKFMSMTNLKFGAAVLAVAAVTTALVVEYQVQIKLRQENESLRLQIAQLNSDNAILSEREAKLRRQASASRMPATDQSTALPGGDLQSTNLYDRFKNHEPRLTAEQVEAYLQGTGRKSKSLLAAYRTSGDPSLLKEAMEKYPNDPQVAFEAAISYDLSPDEKRQWLNKFEQTAPDNALANYLSACNYLTAGQTDQALQELSAASGKALQDYTQIRVSDDEEAYLSAGYSQAEAEAIASQSLALSQLGPLKQMGKDLVALSATYGQSGDEASAQATLQMAMNLGQTVANQSTGAALVSQLTGIAIERLALGAMDPSAPYGDSGQTVGDVLSQLVQNRQAIADLTQQSQSLMPDLTDQDWINFTERRMMFGEVPAMQWVVSKYGSQ